LSNPSANAIAAQIFQIATLWYGPDGPGQLDGSFVMKEPVKLWSLFVTVTPVSLYTLVPLAVSVGPPVDGSTDEDTIDVSIDLPIDANPSKITDAIMKSVITPM
jgi:hypothetical protein